MEPKKSNKKFLFIFLAMLIIGGIYGTLKYIDSQGHETTDDAQVEKNMNPIIPKISGYITKVYVKDNEFVKKSPLQTDSFAVDCKIGLMLCLSTILLATKSPARQPVSSKPSTLILL